MKPLSMNVFSSCINDHRQCSETYTALTKINSADVSACITKVLVVVKIILLSMQYSRIAVVMRLITKAWQSFYGTLRSNVQ